MSTQEPDSPGSLTSFEVCGEFDELPLLSGARNPYYDDIAAFTPMSDKPLTAVERKDVFNGVSTCEGDSGFIGPPNMTSVSSMDLSQRKKTPVVNCTLF